MAIDWTNLFKKYRGLWVALQDDEKTVLAAASSAQKALKEAQKKGYESPILTKIPKDLISYVGYGQ